MVSSAGVGRWLQQRDARRHGISARIRPEFAGRWLWDAMRAVLGGLPQRSPFEAERVRWHLLALFEDFPTGDDFALPAQRMGERGSVARLALADAVARCFERYLAYRRDWLARWQQGRYLQGDRPCGPHEIWQRWLWNGLLERLPEVRDEHPYDAFVRALAGHGPARIVSALDGLAGPDEPDEPDGPDGPDADGHRRGRPRIALFGRIDLSPEQFAIFGQLAQHIDVSFFAPDPCRELWTDLLDPASLARVRAQRPDVAWLYDGEPSILGNWGRVQRDFIAQLHELEERCAIQAEAPGREDDWPFAPDGAEDRPAAPRNVLQALQAAVFRRSDEVWTELADTAGTGPDIVPAARRPAGMAGDQQAGDQQAGGQQVGGREVGGREAESGADHRWLHEDASIRVVGAYGPVREAEILHEALLDCFATIPGLRPEDVVVHCADHERAAPVITGVFASVPAARRIPVRISGLAGADNEILVALQRLLAAVVSGVDLPRWRELLNHPAMLAAAGLDEARARDLLEALERAGARRGLDAADGAPKHNLHSAIDRLLLGAATGADGTCVDLFAVPALPGSRIDALDGLLRVTDALERLQGLAARPRAPQEWCTALAEVVESLFAPVRAHAASVQQVREALHRLAAMSRVAGGIVLDAAGFARALADVMEPTVPAAMPSGAVTVVPMGSLRGVPYRVVCLFGFDEGAFPRRGTRDELDLMRLAPRFGDRLARQDDRGEFLDALLMARDRLFISFCSRDPRDGSARNPCALVAELLSWLSQHLPATGDGPGRRPAPGSLLRLDRSEAPLPYAVIEYPLHPFSRASFEGAAADRADEWLDTARVAVTPLIARVNEIGALGTVDSRSLRGSAVSRRMRGEDVTGLNADAIPGDSLPIEHLSAALSDPAGTWLRESLGLPRAWYVPGDEGKEMPQFEPLWPDGDGDPRRLSRWVQRLLAGGDEDELVRQLERAPFTMAAPGAQLEAQSLVAHAHSAIARVLDGAVLQDARADPAPIVVRVGDLRLRMPAPPRDTQGHLLFVSPWSWSMFALIDAWLRTALWRFAVDRSATGRLIVAGDDEPVVFHCPDPLRALTHAITWSQRIAAQPLPLFPRSWLAYARERRRGAGAEREVQAVRAGDQRLLGDDSGYVQAEIERPEMRALYRDAKPDFAIVLPLCERVYRPLFDDSSLTAAEAS